MAFGNLILDLHHSTTSSLSKDRFLFILITPKSVVCNLAKFVNSSLVTFSFIYPFIKILFFNDYTMSN